jgi:hypothetical protein
MRSRVSKVSISIQNVKMPILAVQYYQISPEVQFCLTKLQLPDLKMILTMFSRQMK